MVEETGSSSTGNLFEPVSRHAPYTGSAEATQEFANTSNQKNLEPTNMSTYILHHSSSSNHSSFNLKDPLVYFLVSWESYLPRGYSERYISVDGRTMQKSSKIHQQSRWALVVFHCLLLHIRYTSFDSLVSQTNLVSERVVRVVECLSMGTSSRPKSCWCEFQLGDVTGEPWECSGVMPTPD